MKVKTFLNKLLMSSSIDTVRIEWRGYTKAEYAIADLRLQEYGIYGDETVKTFSVHDTVLVINI